jgi:CO dehydrogenase/acetyl-CoA synthase gamma subunit (corrinoid Fe-S protein)
MLDADLYLKKIDLCRYWPANAGISCQDFISRIAVGKSKVEDFTFLSRNQMQAFKLVLEAKNYLPSVPLLTIPQPVEKGLLPINQPDENSLVIVTGNNRFTFDVLAAVWAQGITPAHFLLIDCLGNTVDMAMVYQDFTPGHLVQAVAESHLESLVKHRHLILPGFTAPFAKEFAAATNWEIEIGPICAVELPLFLGDRWIFSNKPA